ncbi:MAG: hypothetical protein DHS20C14_20120 [Phycisphaeraceae bacterium]|nr:MAG: hypothetical protein DHS20C14_20120 [Phycisphaeraceae bacterium]
MSRARTCFASAALIAAPIALAQPLQTDYDAEFFLLFDSGALVRGELSVGITDDVALSPLGQTSSALDIAPDGTLYSLGGTADGSPWSVGRVDPESGTVETVLAAADVSADIPGTDYLRALGFAPDNSFYLVASSIAGGGSDVVFAHYTLDGTLLDWFRPTDASGNPVYWPTTAVAIRHDGMIITVENYGPHSSGVQSSARIALVSPATGILTVIGNFPAEENQCRGIAIVGDTAFLALGSRGDRLHSLDPYTGKTGFVMDLPGASNTQTVWGFAVAPDPCAADMTYDDAVSPDDINTFADAFLTGSTAADLDYSRTRSVDDIEVFVDSFLRGCND